MAKIGETPYNIITHNTQTTTIYIRRVTAQMRIEFAYRSVHAMKLAARIQNSLLPQIEVKAVYRHWIPVALYYLPITNIQY